MSERTAAMVRRADGLQPKTAAEVAAAANAVHRPVMLDECIDLVTGGLNESRGHRDSAPVIVDCTLGLAGHATAFLKAAPEAQLIGIDRDGEALALASERMEREGLSDRFTPVHAAFDELDAVLDDLDVERVSAVFMDLGLSSLQIDQRDRGFSYSADAPLDMRMDSSQELTAARVLAEYDERALSRIFTTYGEERFSRQIARAIVRLREEGTLLQTSAQLNELVDRTIPQSHRPAGNPAKRVFQALRIEVNGELDKLARTLPQAALRLAVRGRLVVESYHSLEDRTVKTFMAQGLKADVPADMPVIPLDAQPFLAELTRGAMKAGRAEIESNPRSASVRLRAVELTRELPDRWRKRFEQDAVPDAGGTVGKPIRRNRQGKSVAMNSKANGRTHAGAKRVNERRN